MIHGDTIIAAATPYGHGGIAVVRISGDRSKEIIETFSTHKNPLRNRVSINAILFGEKGQNFDSALITFFKSPNSYTGEDIVEISCHGSPSIVEKIIEMGCKNGARPAEPGEFTKRAFLNGKIDLVQAEAVAGLISSKSTACTQLNQRILSGELSKRFLEIKKDLVGALSYSEFELDVSEEKLVPGSVKHISKKLSSARDSLFRLQQSYREGRLINNGVSVVISGKPNVGKSTLYNAILNENKAIVNSSPGTTRDTLESSFILEGVYINLIDTAGIRETEEEVEKEGVVRAKNRLSVADVILRVVDEEVSDINKDEHENILLVRNKADLISHDDNINQNGLIFVSAKTGFGIDSLKEKLKDSIGVSKAASENIYITTGRQKSAVDSALVYTNKALGLSSETDPELELVSIEIREALGAVDALLGKTTAEEILNSVFSAFCVGK